MLLQRGEVKAVVLEKGAYLYSLKINDKDVILEGKERQTRGGMALLIPYANRVKGGVYEWKGIVYQLPKNAEGNAIHGLVMDKIWDVRELKSDLVKLSLTLTHEGYPSILSLQIEYQLLNDGISVSLSIKNVGEKDAPLTVGFHPYFIVSEDWEINPKKVKKCVSVNKIPTGEVVDYELVRGVYDDCFIIKGRVVSLTSSYSRVEIEKEGLDFVQVYTVPNAVAIEPMSGAPDAYHNGMGLTILQPGKEVSFNVKFRVSFP